MTASQWSTHRLPVSLFVSPCPVRATRAGGHGPRRRVTTLEEGPAGDEPFSRSLTDCRGAARTEGSSPVLAFAPARELSSPTDPLRPPREPPTLSLGPSSYCLATSCRPQAGALPRPAQILDARPTPAASAALTRDHSRAAGARGPPHPAPDPSPHAACGRRRTREARPDTGPPPSCTARGSGRLPLRGRRRGEARPS